MLDLSSADSTIQLSVNSKRKLFTSVDLSKAPTLSAYQSLKGQIASSHGVLAANVVLGNGSDDLIERLARRDHGNSVLTIVPCFERLYEGPSKNANLVDTFQLDEGQEFKYTNTAHQDLLAKLRANEYSALWICNPNNPTGEVISVSILEELAIAVSPGKLIVDESFIEYLDNSVDKSAVLLINKHDNVITLHSFSKTHGLAALRVGYSISSIKLTEAMEKMGIMFGINSMAVEAARLELSDMTNTKNQVKIMQNRKNELLRSIEDIGEYKVVSHSNINLFMLKKKNENSIYDLLLANGIKSKSLAKMEGLKDKGYCRFRVPNNPLDAEQLIKVLQEIAIT